MVDQTALTATAALHAALVAALVASGVTAVVNPARGRALPYVVLSDETATGDLLTASKQARPASHTKTMRVYADTDTEARTLAATATTAALGTPGTPFTVAGFRVVDTALDLSTTGPDNDPSPDADEPLGSRVVRIRYTLAP